MRMIRRLKVICGAVALLCMAAASMAAQTGGHDAEASSRAQIRHLIDVYMQAVDNADPKLAATVFLTTQDASFISPVGHERGWNQIADDVFVKLMGQTFSSRHLVTAGEPVIHVYGDSAVAEFDWDFQATLRSNGAPVDAEGRESQFYVKFPE
jgi:ketosteroid isomerase-like protein